MLIANPSLGDGSARRGRRHCVGDHRCLLDQGRRHSGAVTDRAFDGTVKPRITGFFLVSLAAFLTVVVTERGRLFRET